MTAWIEVRDPITNKLLFRFNPIKNLIEIISRKRQVIIDLDEYRQDEVDDE